MPDSSARPLFITFEGIDGSGKSTQLFLFIKYLSSLNKHNHIVLTREPYKDTDVRKILNAEQNPLTQAEKLADLFIEDRKKHAYELILPSLEKGLHVVSDRYKLSTIAYQSAQGLPIKELINKQSKLPVPDICFLIDLPAISAAKRMRSDESTRAKAHKFEADIDFLEKVRQQYLQAKLLLNDENIFVINAERPIDQIFAEIKEVYNTLTLSKPNTKS